MDCIWRGRFTCLEEVGLGEKLWVQMDCIWRGRFTWLEEVWWLVVKWWVQMDCIRRRQAHMVGGGGVGGRSGGYRWTASGGEGSHCWRRCGGWW